jgi:ferredoxin
MTSKPYPPGQVWVSVDPDACCAAGRCAETEPRLFDQDPVDGTVLLLRSSVDGELAGAARLCADQCPCDAITVEPDRR